MNKEKLFYEEWRDIVGYEGLYQISSYGRVKSLKKYGNVFERILKLVKSPNGYLIITLHKDGKQKTQYVHLTVAKAFLPNPNNLPCVNHKNECKTDNRVENLEWCTHEYNINYGTAIERRSNSRSKAVIKYDLEGNEIARYTSVMEVERQYSFNKKNITACCRGKSKSSYGFIWKYA